MPHFMHSYPQDRGYIPFTEEMRNKVRQLVELTNETTVGELLGATNCKTRIARRALSGKQLRIRAHFYCKVEAELARKLDQQRTEKERARS